MNKVSILLLVITVLLLMFIIVLLLMLIMLLVLIMFVYSFKDILPLSFIVLLLMFIVLLSFVYAWYYPTLALSTSWSFIEGRRLMVTRLLQKLLHFKYVFFSPNLCEFYSFFFYIEYWKYVLRILDYFCRNNFQIGNIIYNLTFYLLLLKDILKQFCTWTFYLHDVFCEG
jgi:hypothetical protein